MKTLSDTLLFKLLNKDDKLKSSLSSIVIDKERVDLEDLEENMRVIQRRFKHSLKNKATSDLVDGNTIAIFNIETIDVPSYLPNWLWLHKGQPKSVINLTNYAKKTKKGLLEIDNRTLFSLLQTASISRYCFFNWNSIANNATIQREAMEIYVRLFNKVLDKVYGVNLNPILADKINYIVAKFFLINIMERSDSDRTNSLAQKAIFNDTTVGTIESFEEGMKDEMYDSIEGLVDQLSVIKELRGFKIRKFLEEWIKMYGESTVLSLEYFPLFCHMIFSSLVSANEINRGFVIENVAGRNITKFYEELSRIIK